MGTLGGEEGVVRRDAVELTVDQYDGARDDRGRREAGPAAGIVGEGDDPLALVCRRLGELAPGQRVGSLRVRVALGGGST